MVSSRDLESPAEVSATSAGPTCLLCDSPNCEPGRSLTLGQLLTGWKAHGVEFSAEAWPYPDDSRAVEVWKCGSCGFEFSDPALAGNAQFYVELQKHGADTYYPKDSLEFHRAIHFAKERGLSTVLDVGCGAGAFLNLAKAAGMKTHGVELNPEGAKVARAAGHHIYDSLLGDLLATGTMPKFDLVTSWQVLEHVSAPVQFLKECGQFVRKGGFLGIAVPCEKTMRWICPYDPHGWPPHHVSRWRLEDLELIGSRAGLRLVGSGADPLYGRLGEHFWTLHNRLAPLLGFKPHRGGTFLPKLFWYLYRKSGARHWSPIDGSSIYAFYTRE